VRPRTLLLTIAFLLPAIAPLGLEASADAATTCGWSLPPRVPIEGIGDFRTGIASPSPNRVWVVADDQSDPIVARFDGTSWRTKRVSDPGYSEGAFQGITAVAPGDIWAVGWHRLTAGGHFEAFAAHWDGSSWTATSPPPASNDHNRFLHAVSASGHDDVWAVGSDTTKTPGDGIVEHWTGSAWTRVAFPFDGESLIAVTAIAPDDVWASGLYASYHWNGQGWTEYPMLSSGGYLVGSSATSSTDVWRAGWDLGGYAERWDGGSWTETPVLHRGTNANYANAVAARSPTNAWIVGSSGGRSYYALVEHWNGSSWHWRRTPLDRMDDTSLEAVSVVPHSQTMWAVGRNGAMLRYC
jgi:hypothetical protein